MSDEIKIYQINADQEISRQEIDAMEKDMQERAEALAETDADKSYLTRRASEVTKQIAELLATLDAMGDVSAVVSFQIGTNDDTMGGNVLQGNSILLRGIGADLSLAASEFLHSVSVAADSGEVLGLQRGIAEEVASRRAKRLIIKTAVVLLQTVRAFLRQVPDLKTPEAVFSRICHEEETQGAREAFSVAQVENMIRLLDEGFCLADLHRTARGDFDRLLKSCIDEAMETRH